MGKPPTLKEQWQAMIADGSWKTVLAFLGGLIFVFWFVSWSRDGLHSFMARLGFEHSSGAWAFLVFGFIGLAFIASLIKSAYNWIRRKASGPASMTRPLN